MRGPCLLDLPISQHKMEIHSLHEIFQFLSVSMSQILTVALEVQACEEVRRRKEET